MNKTPHRPLAGPPLEEVYARLVRRWGTQGWWPGRTRFETIVGAILVQNTAWPNVEKAIRALRRAGALRPDVIHTAPLEQVAAWIRPAGTHRVKAGRLRAFTHLLYAQFNGNLSRMLREEPGVLRERLLAVRGIGPETADNILLYAAGRPVFVVDAYTRRFMLRHGWLQGPESYDKVAARFTDCLPRDAARFNEFHALIVKLGKEHCRTRPECEGCPLRSLLPPRGPIES